MVRFEQIVLLERVRVCGLSFDGGHECSPWAVHGLVWSARGAVLA